MSVADNWKQLQKKVSEAQARSKQSAAFVTVIGVTKLQVESKIEEGIACGITDFGENYVQELLPKIDKFRDAKIHWHLIGPLQSNKVKLVVGAVDIIHTVDRFSLAEVISKFAEQRKIKQKVLIQVNVSGEDSKSGVGASDAEKLVREMNELKSLDIVGLMTMPPIAEVAESSRRFFIKLRELRDQLNEAVWKKQQLRVLSMGTSQDFEVAIEEGATHVRVGSTLFGERE